MHDTKVSGRLVGIDHFFSVFIVILDLVAYTGLFSWGIAPSSLIVFKDIGGDQNRQISE